MKNHADALLSTKEAAEYLGVKPATLAAWRQRGNGPAYFRVGKLARYRRSDLDKWLERNRRFGTQIPTELQLDHRYGQ